MQLEIAGNVYMWVWGWVANVVCTIARLCAFAFGYVFVLMSVSYISVRVYHFV